MIKKILALTSIIFISFIFFSNGKVAEARIELNTGKIPHEAYETSFKIKNNGFGILKLVGFSTSCGCTSAELNKKYLLPFQETEVNVVFDPNIMGEVVGEFERVIYVETNDNNNPEVEFILTGEVYI